MTFISKGNRNIGKMVAYQHYAHKTKAVIFSKKIRLELPEPGFKILQ